MTGLQLTSRTADAVLPTLKGGGCVLRVYDGLPDEQPWLTEALIQARVCAPAEDAAQLEGYAQDEHGAPYGNFTHTSTRVARVTGLLTETGGEKDLLTGVALAHGQVCAYWEQNEEGTFIVVDFAEPTCVGWGAAKNSLCQEQLKVRCMRQYEAQARSVLEHTADVELAHSVLVRFIGDWDDSTQLIRRSLGKACVQQWAALLSPATLALAA